MIHVLAYRSADLSALIKYYYNDVSHLVEDGTIGSTISPGPSDLYPGQPTGYSQTVGGTIYRVFVKDSYPYAFVESESIGLPCDLVIDTVTIAPAMNGLNGSITVTGASGGGTKRYALDGGVRGASTVFLNVPPGSHIITLSRTEDACTATLVVNVASIPDLQISFVGTNCSANGVDDGIAVLTVVTGSGDFSANFVTEGVTIALITPPPVSTNRVSLAPGTYQVTVTDNVTGQIVSAFVTIVYPAAVPPPVVIGTVFEIPFINGLTFVKENSNPQQLDNVLFKDQKFGRFKQLDFFNPRVGSDTEKLQFFSNYAAHALELRDYCTDEVVKTFECLNVQSNIGSKSDLGIILKDNGSGQSRVYFSVGPIPIPIAVGDTFDVTDSVEGFDGTYTVLAVNLDTDLGLNYLIITLLYDSITSQSYAVGTFNNALTNYDVFEATIGYAGIIFGQYYFKLTALASNTIIANSEPVEISDKLEDTLGVIYSSLDNGDGVTWQTGYRGFIRIPGFIFKRLPGGVRTISRNSNYSPVKVSSKSQRFVELDVFTIPPYLHEKLAVIFDQDFFNVNGLAFQMTDGYPAPKYVDMYPLADAEIKIEQLNWFNSYNSSDSPTQNNDMDCACDTIDLLKVSSVPSVITLNLAQKKARVFSIEPAILEEKTWALSNDFLALSFKVIFSISDLFAQTFPATFKMNDIRWDAPSKTWTPAEAGTYQAEGVFDGTNWQVVISQSTFI